jgi:hypothetical protein
MTPSDKKPRRTAKSPKTPKTADTAGVAVTDAAKAPVSAAGETVASAALGKAISPVRSSGSAKPREPRIKDISVSVTSRHREDRHASIALAAYFRSESRGFAPGHEVEDWLAAEEEVDQRLLGEGRVS